MNGTELRVKKYTLHTYGQMIFDKGTKAMQCSKNIFSTNEIQTIRYPRAKNKLQSKPYPLPKKLPQNGL